MIRLGSYYHNYYHLQRKLQAHLAVEQERSRQEAEERRREEDLKKEEEEKRKIEKANELFLEEENKLHRLRVSLLLCVCHPL
jgi:superfamily I DNA and/or RNA helicase